MNIVYAAEKPSIAKLLSEYTKVRVRPQAAGNFFLALVGVPKSDLTWTRGEPATFMSSEMVQRGFCAECGTPLFFHRESNSYISMTTGSFDHPEDIPVANQCVQTEGRPTPTLIRRGTRVLCPKYALRQGRIRSGRRPAIVRRQPLARPASQCPSIIRSRLTY